MPPDESIMDLISRSPGVRAADIAKQLGLDKTRVNSILYGPLKNQVRQDSQYRWWPARESAVEPQTEAPPPLPKTPLGRLCQYYLDCMAQELESGVSTFASSKYGDPDYAELAANPFSDSANALSGEPVRRIVNKYRMKRNQLVLFLGYPTRLRLMKSRKSSWEGFMVDPLFLFPLEIDAASGPRLADGSPILNMSVLSAMNNPGGGRPMEEALRLAEELGLMAASEDTPDPDELVMRLRSIRPEWDWQEQIDPSVPPSATPLSQLNQQGIFNRAVILTAERSKYTVGLEAELAELQKAPESTVAGTQLGQWLNGRPETATTPPPVTLLEPLPLNSEQRLAVQRGLSQPLTVITGPPGTGKSQVVTSLLINAAFQGKRVLFASKNNKAVDVVEERVNSLGSRPVLLRMGANEHRSRLAEYLSSLLSATATADDQATYQEHRSVHDRMSGEVAKLEGLKEKLLAARNLVDKLEQEVEGARQVFGAELFASMATFDPSEVEPLVSALRAKAFHASREKQGFFVRLFWSFVSKTRFDELTAKAASARDKLPKLGIALPEAPPSDTSVSGYLVAADAAIARLATARAVRAYFDALTAIRTTPSLEDLAKRQAELTDQIASNSEKLWDAWVRLQPTKLNAAQRKVLQDYSAILQLMVRADDGDQAVGKEIWGKNRRLYPEVVKTLSCWAVTSLSARGRIPLEPGFFDILIIDEASQCDIASALPLLYRAKAAVIIGDPNQLRHISSVPVAKDRQLMVKHELIDNFAGWSYSVTSLFDLASGFTLPSDIVALRDHHRSHADIISFSNDQFYEGRLRVATRYQRLKLPARDEPAVRWRSVTGDVHRPASGGAVNRVEAQAVIQALSDLVLTRGYRGSVGVVSPFRAQANLINELATQNAQLFDRLSALDFLADTVHSFQGDERDIIIFSPVVSRGISDGALGFLRSNRNLFNVAITRARAALWTVGDLQAALSSGVDYLAEFARYTQQLGQQRAQATDLNQDFGPAYPAVRNPERVSDWERLLYRALYAAGIRSVPQYPEENYALDFAIFVGDRKLNVEVDGERYHREWTGELCRRDMIRNQRLIELGWEIKRFWVYQVRDDCDGCVAWIRQWAASAAASAVQAPAESSIANTWVRDFLIENPAFAVSVLSLHYPFTRAELDMWMGRLVMGTAHYSWHCADTDVVHSPRIGLCFNCHLPWDDELRTLWSVGYVNLFRGSLEGTGLPEPVEVDESCRLRCLLPLSVITELNALMSSRISAWVSSPQIASSEPFGPPIEDVEQALKISRDCFQRLGELEFLRLYRESPRGVLYNRTIWEFTLREAIDAQFLKHLLEGKENDGAPG